MESQIELVWMSGIQRGALSWAAQKTPGGLTMAIDIALLQGSTEPPD